MIVLAGILVGAVLGALRARARQGNRLDMLQYGTAYAIIFALIGMFITIFLERML